MERRIFKQLLKMKKNPQTIFISMIILFFLIIFTLLLMKDTEKKDFTGMVTHSVYPSFSSAQNRLSLTGDRLIFSDKAVYKQAYYSINGAQWQPFMLEGTPYNGNNQWILNSAIKYLPHLGQGVHYVTIYSCYLSDNKWDCHGNTQNTKGSWQLHIINNSDLTEETLFIVNNSIGLADIVVDSNAPNMVKLASQYFQNYINDMTGVVLPILNSPSDDYDFHVFIGRSNYTDSLGINCAECEHGGFKIIAADNYLVLIGDDTTFPGGCDWNSYNSAHGIDQGDDRGSMNAVHQFLYEQGMRWYYPSDIGTIIPTKQDISFQSTNRIINPDFPMRHPFIWYKTFGHLRGNLYPHFEDLLSWQLSLGFNCIGEFSTGGIVHGTDMVTNKAETIAAHPEFYAIWDGVRMTNPPHPDLCSEGLLEANVQLIRDLVETKNATMVSVMPSDGFSRASESSDECKARETKDRPTAGHLSDYVWEYVNNVAWEIYDEYGTNVTILGGAYAHYQLPPLNLSRPFAPNVAAIITKWRTWTANPAQKQHFQNLTDEWINILPSGTIYTYDYYLHNRAGSTTQAFPFFFPKLIDEDLKFLKGKSGGEFMELYSEWPDFELHWDPFAATAFNLYVTGKLYWDVDQDVDELLDEYYDLFYGPASSQMKAIVEHSEENIINALGGSPYVLAPIRALAEEGLAIAGEHTIYGQRIKLLLDLINSNYIGEEVFIDSCQALDSPGTTYKLTNDVTSQGRCFFIDADGVTLDCQGHKITYSLSGEANHNGIYINSWNSYRGDFFNITNCVIQDGSYLTGETTGSAISISSADFGVIENNFINASGIGIYTVGATNNKHIGNTVLTHSDIAFYSQYGSYAGSDTISSNLFLNNVYHSQSANAMYLYRSKYDNLTNNTLTSFTGHGLHLFNCEHCRLQDNLISSETKNGLLDWDGLNNTFINNTIING
jgi:parallel beta-helix repeat protein